jgi:hypothetical protein
MVRSAKDLEAWREYNDQQNAKAYEQWLKSNPPIPGDPLMPNVSQMIQSKYLSKADLPVPVIATIKGVNSDQFQAAGSRAPETRWLLWFAELPKALKLNATNIRILEAGFGPESDRWIGRRVRVFVDMSIQMAGQTVGGIRLQCPTVPATVLAGAPALPAGAKFDPLTGAPLAQLPSPAQAAPRFDPYTGAPLAPVVEASTGEVRPDLEHFNGPAGREPGFDDEIPF